MLILLIQVFDFVDCDFDDFVDSYFLDFVDSDFPHFVNADFGKCSFITNLIIRKARERNVFAFWLLFSFQRMHPWVT